jgi:TraX protein.
MRGNMMKESYQVFNRDIIKFIAMLAMSLNHIASIFMKRGLFITEVFIDIGYLTAITMCYFLVEGYYYTHSKKKYGLRLAIFAMISELPYCLAFTRESTLSFCGFNMMVTLLICFFILVINDRISNHFLKGFMIFLMFFISIFSDWPLFAPLFTLLFIWAKDYQKRLKIAFLIAMLLFGLFSFIEYIEFLPLHLNLLYSLGRMCGIAIGGILVVYLYNGKPGSKSDFSKWFFYWFYPLHLFTLGIMRIIMLF